MRPSRRVRPCHPSAPALAQFTVQPRVQPAGAAIPPSSPQPVITSRMFSPMSTLSPHNNGVFLYEADDNMSSTSWHEGEATLSGSGGWQAQPPHLSGGRLAPTHTVDSPMHVHSCSAFRPVDLEADACATMGFTSPHHLVVEGRHVHPLIPAAARPVTGSPADPWHGGHHSRESSEHGLQTERGVMSRGAEREKWVERDSRSETVLMEVADVEEHEDSQATPEPRAVTPQLLASGSEASERVDSAGTSSAGRIPLPSTPSVPGTSLLPGTPSVLATPSDAEGPVHNPIVPARSTDLDASTGCGDTVPVRVRKRLAEAEHGRRKISRRESSDMSPSQAPTSPLALDRRAAAASQPPTPFMLHSSQQAACLRIASPTQGPRNTKQTLRASLEPQERTKPPGGLKPTAARQLPAANTAPWQLPAAGMAARHPSATEIPEAGPMPAQPSQQKSWHFEHATEMDPSAPFRMLAPQALALMYPELHHFAEAQHKINRKALGSRSGSGSDSLATITTSTTGRDVLAAGATSAPGLHNFEGTQPPAARPSPNSPVHSSTQPPRPSSAVSSIPAAAARSVVPWHASMAATAGAAGLLQSTLSGESTILKANAGLGELLSAQALNALDLSNTGPVSTGCVQAGMGPSKGSTFLPATIAALIKAATASTGMMGAAASSSLLMGSPAARLTGCQALRGPSTPHQHPLGMTQLPGAPLSSLPSSSLPSTISCSAPPTASPHSRSRGAVITPSLPLCARTLHARAKQDGPTTPERATVGPLPSRSPVLFRGALPLRTRSPLSMGPLPSRLQPSIPTVPPVDSAATHQHSGVQYCLAQTGLRDTPFYLGFSEAASIMTDIVSAVLPAVDTLIASLARNDAQNLGQEAVGTVLVALDQLRAVLVDFMSGGSRFATRRASSGSQQGKSLLDSLNATHVLDELAWVLSIVETVLGVPLVALLPGGSKSQQASDSRV